MPASEGHSQTMKCQGRQVKTAKECQRARTIYHLPSEEGGTHQDSESQRAKVIMTHSLSSEEGSTSQDSGRKPAREKHSRPVESRVRDNSGQQTNTSEQGTLTPY